MTGIVTFKRLVGKAGELRVTGPHGGSGPFTVVKNDGQRVRTFGDLHGAINFAKRMVEENKA